MHGNKRLNQAQKSIHLMVPHKTKKNILDCNSTRKNTDLSNNAIIARSMDHYESKINIALISIN